ncbi:DNA-methyltransferase [Culicoidibacter larvae]|nr:site-specific DNA-methyltransferase [Culicoidibacter larvae]
MLGNLQVGDCIRIDGKHLLVYGDATKIETYSCIEKHGSSVQLLLTDPPYNVNYSGTKRKNRRQLINDNLGDRYTEFLTRLLDNAARVMNPGASYYVFMASSSITELYAACDAAELYRSSLLLWIKNHFVLSFADYKVKHECIQCGWKRGATHKFYDPKNLSTVFNYPKPTRSKEHPTMKPIPLVKELIQYSSMPGDIVLDPCSGSGTTMLAAQEFGRRCYMIEIDLEYIHSIIYRYLYFNPGAVIEITQ